MSLRASQPDLPAPGDRGRSRDGERPGSGTAADYGPPLPTSRRGLSATEAGKICKSAERETRYCCCVCERRYELMMDPRAIQATSCRGQARTRRAPAGSHHATAASDAPATTAAAVPPLRRRSHRRSARRCHTRPGSSVPPNTACRTSGTRRTRRSIIIGRRDMRDDGFKCVMHNDEVYIVVCVDKFLSTGARACASTPAGQSPRLVASSLSTRL